MKRPKKSKVTIVVFCFLKGKKYIYQYRYIVEKDRQKLLNRKANRLFQARPCVKMISRDGGVTVTARKRTTYLAGGHQLFVYSCAGWHW